MPQVLREPTTACAIIRARDVYSLLLHFQSGTRTQPRIVGLSQDIHANRAVLFCSCTRVEWVSSFTSNNIIRTTNVVAAGKKPPVAWRQHTGAVPHIRTRSACGITASQEQSVSPHPGTLYDTRIQSSELYHSSNCCRVVRLSIRNLLWTWTRIHMIRATLIIVLFVHNGVRPAPLAPCVLVRPPCTKTSCEHT